jgi:hypothetical protein
LRRASFALLLAMVVVLTAYAAVRQRLEVVIIHSYHQDYPWTSLQHEGFTGALSRALPGYDINFSAEYLDTKRVRPSTNYLQKFQHYLQAKYRNVTPDLIYITDDNAMNFMLAAGGRLFPATPVIFSGVNNLALAETLDRQRITGVFERKRVEPSIGLVRSGHWRQNRGSLASPCRSGDCSYWQEVAGRLVRSAADGRSGRNHRDHDWRCAR